MYGRLQALGLRRQEAGPARALVLRTAFATTLEKMARGGVYDQLAGGFHRYSVDERWIVPHFEKMSYDNSELLKNYVHAYQAAGNEFFADIARDIIRWMDEWLSDREHGGFYARRTRTFRSTTMATISPGRSKKPKLFSPKKKRRSQACTTTSTKSARCTTIRRRTFCFSGLRSRR